MDEKLCLLWLKMVELVLVKYNEICNNIKKTLGIKSHSMSLYDEKYIKTKIKWFNGVVNTNFLGDEVPK